MAGQNSVYVNILFSGGIGFLFLLAFEFLRNRETDIYAPRCRVDPNTMHTPLMPSPVPKAGLFQWIPQVWQFHDAQLLKMIGMDAYVHVRFLTFCGNLCVVCSFGAFILMLVYFSAAKSEHGSTVNGIHFYLLRVSNLMIADCGFLFVSFMYFRSHSFFLSMTNINVSYKLAVYIFLVN